MFTTLVTPLVRQESFCEASKNEIVFESLIPRRLKKFSINHFLLKEPVYLDSISGQAIQVKEKVTVTKLSENDIIESIEQNICLKLRDGTEQRVQLVDFGAKVRVGDFITLLIGKRNQDYYFVAVYNYALRKLFYNKDAWKPLLFGGLLRRSLNQIGYYLLGYIFSVVIFLLLPLLLKMSHQLSTAPWLLSFFTAFLGLPIFYFLFEYPLEKEFIIHLRKIFSI